jgi:hypothetical protein
MIRPTSITRHLQYVLLLLLTLCCSWGLTACTDNEVVTNSYKTLKVAAATYDGAMQSAALLYGSGQIDEQTRDQVIRAGLKFQLAHQAASLALDAYATALEGQDKGAMDAKKIKLDTALAETTQLLGQLATLIGQYRNQDTLKLEVPAAAATPPDTDQQSPPVAQ